MKDLLRLIRPKQWLKNIFVLLRLFFGGNLLNLHDVGATLAAVAAFSLAASSIYCFNDIIDKLELDLSVSEAFSRETLIAQRQLKYRQITRNGSSQACIPRRVHQTLQRLKRPSDRSLILFPEL